MKLECETAGTKGNISSEKLIYQQYIEGLEKIEIAQILEYAKDIETLEHLRERYYQKAKKSLHLPAMCITTNNGLLKLMGRRC